MRSSRRVTKPKPPELHKPRGGPRVPGPGKKLGRPPASDASRTNPVQVMLSDDELAALDENRGILSRPEMIRHAASRAFVHRSPRSK